MVLEFADIKLAESPERDSLPSIRSYAANALQNLVDCHFTDHSINHSYRMLKIVNRILEQTSNDALLTDLEKYVLYASILLHDIGMQEELAVQDSIERRQNHEILSIVRIKKDFKQIGLIEDMVDIVCEIIKAHRGNFSEYATKCIRTCQVIRIDLLESLLFLSDELDITHERVNILNIGRLKYTADNYMHFYKHYYTEAIDIDNTRAIKVCYRYPKNRKQEYEIILKRLVEEKIKDSLNRVKPVLNSKYNVNIFFGEPSCIETSSIQLMDIDTYQNIVGNLLLPKSIFLLKSLNFNQMIDCHDPDLFYNGDSRWEDIVNGLDISRKQTSMIKQQMLDLMDHSCKKQCQNLLLITGEAGSGKTTLLMRVAYELLADSHFKKVNLLWYDGQEPYEADKILNYYEYNLEPIIVFIDTPNLFSFVQDMISVAIKLESRKAPVVLVITARQSEWDNAFGDKFISADKKYLCNLEGLCDDEIKQLLQRLELHNKLGVLNKLTTNERFEKFKGYCDRQLLVAMLEATSGKKFEDIIIDEYEKLKSIHPESARAYEFISLFYTYYVSTPKSLLLRLLSCFDDDDFVEKIIKHTRLIIVKDTSKKFGDYYKARHQEIAKTLISRLHDYDTELKKLKQIGIVIKNVNLYERYERYHIIDFLKNYIENIMRTKPAAEYEDSINDLKNMLIKIGSMLDNMIDKSYQERRVSDLVNLSNIFYRLKLWQKYIEALRRIVELNKLDIKANYYLATALARSKVAAPIVVAGYYKNSYAGGNRSIKFLIEYISYCIKNGLEDNINPLVDGIDDFVVYDRHENDLKEKLKSILDGYKLYRDKNKLITETADLLINLNTTRGLKAKDEIDYIDLYELSNPAQALTQYEQYLQMISPNEPKSILLRIAHTASKIPRKQDVALKYYEKLFEKVERKKPDDFAVVYEYFKFCLKNEISYPNNQYYKIFSYLEDMNPNEIGIYSDFAAFLLKSNDSKDVNYCKKIIDKGLKIAAEIDKLYIGPSKLLRQLKKKFI